ALGLDGDEVGAPAGGGYGASAGVQGCKVGVAHEGRGLGLGSEQIVPGSGVNFERRAQHPNDIITLSHGALCAPRRARAGHG
ncbi:MAG: hypothetical protein RIR09_973, partial [Pseudomonadota bacterium]